jgi:hypothetical protein
MTQWMFDCQWDISDTQSLSRQVSQLRKGISLGVKCDRIKIPLPLQIHEHSYTFADEIVSQGHLDVVIWLHQNICNMVTANMTIISIIHVHTHILDWMDREQHELLVLIGTTFDLPFEIIIDGNMANVVWLSKSSFQAELFSESSIFAAATDDRVPILKFLFRQRPDIFTEQVVQEAKYWAGTFGDSGLKAIRYLSMLPADMIAY